MKLKKSSIHFLASTLAALTLITLVSCESLQNETIEPIADPSTVAEVQDSMYRLSGGDNLDYAILQREDDNEENKQYVYLKVKYKVQNFDINEVSDEASSSIERYSKPILKILGKLFFSLGGDIDLDMSEMTFPIPEFEIDKEMVKDVKVSKIFIEFSNQESSKNTFKFIKKFNVKGEVENKSIRKSEVVQKAPNINLQYKRSMGKDCNYKCINLDLPYTGNLVELMAQGNRITVTPELELDGVPHKSIELIFNGYVELLLKLKLSF
jgi:hypothetical protein